MIELIGPQQVTPVLSVKVFAVAAVAAVLLDTYALQMLRQFHRWFSREEFVNTNLNWLLRNSTVQFVLGDGAILYMKRRTLLFPAFEVAFATLVVAALYGHGVGGLFVRDVLFLAVGLPLALVSWKDDPERAVAPDVLTLGGCVLGLLSSPLAGNGELSDSLSWLGKASVCGALGGAFLWVVSVGYERATGVDGMGIGAVKTQAMVGTFVVSEGGHNLLLSSFLPLLIACLLGSVTGILMMILRGLRREDPIAFVPFQVVGGVGSMLWGTTLVSWYVASFT